ncbi:MAG TPA: HAMP domain-containing sensor histidine kinase [Planctomycetaceae bacterium]|nr:HAMP domain-containing sensor histidine kinase [Planctomycetaceae bacterium]
MPETVPTDEAGDGRLLELKLRALAEFAAGAGHEINNPIATIIGYVQQLLAAERDPDRRHALTTIGAQAYRIRDMIGDVMLFARPPTPRPQEIELAELVDEVSAKFADQARDSRIRLQVESGPKAPVYADPVQLRVVVGSLLRNSMEALASGGTIVIKAQPAEKAGRRWALITVQDDGPGLSEPDREHLFDPFYSGRQAGRGLGFGLSKCWRIVCMHGGRIEVESPPEGGTVITVLWPADRFAERTTDGDAESQLGMS